MSVILRGQSATIVSYPRIHAGRLPLSPPTAPEFRFSTASTAWTDEDETWSTGTVDDLDVSVAAAAREGDTEIDLDDTTDVVVGRRYLLVDADRTQVVEVLRKDAERLYLADMLRRDVGDTARLVGWAITASLTATDTDLAGPAVVQFRCDLDDVAVSWTEAVRVARRMAVVPLTSGELTRVYPEIKSMHARQDETLEDLILSAWDHVLMPRVMRHGYWPEDIVNADVLRPTLALACMLHVARQSRNVDAGYINRLSTDFDRLLDNTTASILWHTETQTIANIPREPSDEQRNAARYRSLRR